ncbi:MAG: hypothetical protein AVDCRST_MAG61-250, partial [uncultured Friedmanniella sp.]
AARAREDQVDQLGGEAEVVDHQQRTTEGDGLQGGGRGDGDQPPGGPQRVGHRAGGEADGARRHLAPADQVRPQHVV